MAAIEKFVFEEEMVTLPQLVEILKNNWEGNQVLQMKMINEGAKFGNGQKEAGNLACEMVNYFVERVEAYNSRYGDLIFSPCIATFSWIVNIGKRIEPPQTAVCLRIPLPLTCLRFCPGMYQAPWRL